MFQPLSGGYPGCFTPDDWSHRQPSVVGHNEQFVKQKPTNQGPSYSDSQDSLEACAGIHGSLGDSPTYSLGSSIINSPESTESTHVHSHNHTFDEDQFGHLQTSSCDAPHDKRDAPNSITHETHLALADVDLMGANCRFADQCRTNDRSITAPQGVCAKGQPSCEASSKSVPFYSFSPKGFATPEGFREPDEHCFAAQTGGYFTSPFRNVFTKGSQDLTVPPPTSAPPVSCTSPPSLSLLRSIPPPYQSQQPPIPESVREIIICKQCKKTHRWPHALHCLHVFCFPCLTTTFDPVDQSITCPLCGLKSSLKDGPCSLKMDGYTSRKMLQMTMSPFVCTACTRGQDAIMRCKTCMAYLCSDCQVGHQTMKHFLNHTLAPITKLRQISDDIYTHFCDLHPVERLTNYCCACNQLICTVCLPGHQHVEYDKCCTTVAEVFPIVAEGLRKHSQECDVKIEDLFGIAQKGPVSKKELDQKERKGLKEIDDYCNYLHAVVQQNRRCAHEQLKATLLHIQQESQTVVNNAQKACEDMKRYKDFANRTVNRSAPEDALMSLETMEEAFKRAVVYCSKITKENEHIQGEVKFSPNYKETHEILNKNFACIFHSDNQVVPKSQLLTSMEGSHQPLNHGPPSHRYMGWSVTPETMPISTWNSVSDSEKKNGTLIPALNRCRTKTAYIHTFGECGQGDYAFSEPSGQAYLADGSYVVCDTNNHRIVHFSASHEYLHTIGQPPNLPQMFDGPEGRNRGKMFARQNGYLYFPNRVAICPLTQNIVATERSPSHDVQIFSPAGHFLRCFGGNILQHPRGVTVDEEGTIIVVECRIMKLVMFSQTGSLIASHSLSQGLQFPNDIAAKDKKILISDNRGHCVLVYNYNAEFLYKIGNEQVTYFPIGVSINHLNQVVVTDNHNTFNMTIFDMSGTVLHLFESVTKLAQCHSVSVHPSRLELMLSTKNCSLYFFSYDPEGTHALKPPVSHRSVNTVSKTMIRF